MSEEIVPKLRLKPRLTKDSSATPPAATPPAEPAPVAIPPTPAPAPAATVWPPVPSAPVADAKSVRLKPRLANEGGAPRPTEPAAIWPAPAPEPAAVAPAPTDPSAPVPPPWLNEAPPKFTIKPNPAGSPTSVPAAAPAATGPLPRVLNAPPPPGLGLSREKTGADLEPAEITIMRQVSTMPFPPPTANLPSLLGDEESGRPGAASPAGPRKNKILRAAIGVVLVAVVVFSALVA